MPRSINAKRDERKSASTHLGNEQREISQKKRGGDEPTMCNKSKHKDANSRKHKICFERYADNKGHTIP